MVQIESHKKKGGGTLAVRDLGFASYIKCLIGIVLASKAKGGYLIVHIFVTTFTSRLPCHA